MGFHRIGRRMSAWLVCGLLSAGAASLTMVVQTPTVCAQDNAAPQEREERIKRFLEILERTPTEGFVLKQLLTLVGQGQRLERLIEEYQAKVEKEPKKLAYRLIVGHLFKAIGRYPEALQAYEDAAKVNPRSVDAWLGKGLTLQLHKRQAEAGPAFEKALSLEKDRSRKQDILRNLATIAFQGRSWDDAERYYKALIRLEGNNNNYLYQEFADVLVQYGRYEQALTVYKGMRDRAGRNVKERVEAMRDMGDALALLERYDEALKIWKQAKGLVAGDSYLRREMDARIIQVYRDQNNLSELVQLYEKQWGNPDHDQAMTLAGLHDELGNEDRALEYFRTALKRNGSSVDARLRVIRIMERRGDAKEVIREYEKLIKSNPSQASYQFELAEIHRRNGDERKASQVATNIGRKFSNDSLVLADLAALYQNWGQPDTSLGIYQKLVKIAPEDPENLIALGDFHWQNGEQDKAIGIWKKILTSMPVRAEAHAVLAEVFVNHGGSSTHNMIELAVEQYREAIKLDDGNDQLYRGLAIAYERGRQVEKAIAAWRDLLSRARQGFMRQEARSKVIQLLSRRDGLRKSLAKWEQQFNATPPDLEAGYFLGEGYSELKDYRRAEAVFKKLITQNGDDVEALLALHKIYSISSKHKENIEVLTQIAKLVPLRARDYYHEIAELSLKLYEDKQAIEFAKKAVDLNPNDAGAYARLGRIYRQMQDLRQAVNQYRTALDLDPQAFRYYFELAEIYLALDQIRDADTLYRGLAKRARDDGMILRAGRKAIDINDSLGSLDALEADFGALSNAQRPRQAYGQLLIELYDRMTRDLVASLEYGAKSDHAEAERKLQEVSRRAVGPLLQALQSEDMSLKLTAIRILGDLRNGNAALPLARQLEERDSEIRRRAALASGKLGDARALQPMLRALGDNDLTIREIAVWSLGRMKSKDGVAELQRLLKTDAPWTLRALAAVSLGRIGDPKAVDVLGQLLSSSGKRDQKTEVRVACAWGLGALGSAAGKDPLIQAITADPDPSVRRMAAWALGNLASSPDALKALLEAYWSSGPEVREVAGKALLRLGPGSVGEKPAYVAWEENLGFFDFSAKTFNVAFFLSTLLSNELLAQGDDGSFAIITGEAALKSLLARQIDQAQADHLAYLLYDLDQSEKTISLGALTWSLPKDKARRAEVEKALGRIGASLVPKLTELLASKDPLVRAHAAGVLGKIGVASAVDPLIKVLADKNKDVRRKAAFALGQIGDKRATKPLLGHLSDKYWASRAHAAAALGLLGNADAIDPLVKALDDGFPWVQASAAEALGQLGDKRATPGLVSRLEKAAPPVKLEILRALARIGGADAAKALGPYRDDPDPQIRKAVGM